MSDTAGEETAASHFLVLVSDSSTFEETVAYAAREVREVAAETDSRLALTIATPAVDTGPRSESVDTESLLATARSVAEEATELTDPEGHVDIRTETIAQYRYPFDPYEYADSILEFAAANDVGTVVVDPAYGDARSSPMTGSLADQLRANDVVEFEIAPVSRASESSSIVARGGLAQFLSVFGISFVFYLLVGGLADLQFDVVTGVASALIVAGILSRVTFESQPRPRRMVASVARWLLYVPYLGAKILIANVQMAYVVLHPELPIDPSVERFEPGVWGGLPVATLANSITLTPGTLTVDVEDRELVVHSLTPGSRADLLDGGLERAVRFVFYGRTALSYPSPRERAESEEGDSS